MSKTAKNIEIVCPLVGFHRTVGGKYKLRILWDLKNGPVRYGKIRKALLAAEQGNPVTPRVLSRELKELEKRGLISRKQYPVVPPKVEYRLTEIGRSIIPVIASIGKWGVHMQLKWPAYRDSFQPKRAA